MSEVGGARGDDDDGGGTGEAKRARDDGDDDDHNGGEAKRARGDDEDDDEEVDHSWSIDTNQIPLIDAIENLSDTLESSLSEMVRQLSAIKTTLEVMALYIRDRPV